MDVESILNSIATERDSLMADADDAVERLESLVTSRQTWVEFNPLDNVDLSKIPSLTTADLPTLDKTPLDFDMAEFDPNIYKGKAYQSDFFDSVQPQLLEMIETGGIGISADVQQAIFDQQKQRDLQAADDALVLARSSHAKRGFPMPTDMMMVAEQQVVQRFQEVKDNRSREITVLIADRAQQNFQQAVQQGIAVERAQMEFSLGLARLFTEVNNALLTRFKVEQDARVSEFEGQLKGVLATIQVGETNAKLDLAYQEQVLEKWRIESSLAVEKTKALIQEAEHATKIKLQASVNLAEFYRTLVHGSQSMLNGVVSQEYTDATQ